MELVPRALSWKGRVVMGSCHVRRERGREIAVTQERCVFRKRRKF